jgi:hypothetical protein
LIGNPGPVITSPDGDSSESKDSKEEEGIIFAENMNYNKAVAEFKLFENYKRKKYRPILDPSKSSILSGEDSQGKAYEIAVGPVLSSGKDLPSCKNIADYIDCRGRMDNTKFALDHCTQFPTLWILVRKEAAMKSAEVKCERFFNLSGNVSAPNCTRLGVRIYKCLAMLVSILPNVYLDKEWVANEYLRRCKCGAWKKENTVEALKCWNLECIIDAEMLGKPPPTEMTLEQLVQEEDLANTSVDKSDDDVIVVGLKRM